MNERIKELAEQAGIEFVYDPTETPMRAFVECWGEDLEKFAELIVKEHLHIMKTEWYEINSMPVDPEGKSPMDAGIRLGRKSEVVVLMSKISKHFGVEE